MAPHDIPVFPDDPRLELDEALTALLAHAERVQHSQGRLRALFAASQSVVEAIDLPALLRRIVEAAIALVGCGVRRAGCHRSRTRCAGGVRVCRLADDGCGAHRSSPRGARPSRCADHGSPAHPPGGYGERQACGRLSSASPGDDEFPGRAHSRAQRGLRQSLPDQSTRRALHRGGRAARLGARDHRRVRDRQCTVARRGSHPREVDDLGGRTLRRTAVFVDGYRVRPDRGPNRRVARRGEGDRAHDGRGLHAAAHRRREREGRG